MALHIVCPAGHRLAVPLDRTGQKVVCPQCGRSVIVPPPAQWPASDQGGASSPPGPPAPPPPPAPTGLGQPAGPPPAAAAQAGPSPDDPGGALHQQPFAGGERAGRTAGAQPSGGRSAAGEGELSPPASRPLVVWELSADLPRSPYQADRGKIATLRWLALCLLGITLLGASPALLHFPLAGAPWWALLVLLIAALQTLYIFWMVTLPDWSTAWVLMLVFAVSAALYGCGLAVALVAPPTPEMPLDLYGVRRLAVPWSAAMVLLTFLGAYLCGRFSHRWYRSFTLAWQAPRPR